MLSGWVTSLAEHMELERIVFGTPAVSHLVDTLIVTG